LNSRQSSSDGFKAGDKVTIKLSSVPNKDQLKTLRQEHLKNRTQGNDTNSSIGSINRPANDSSSDTLGATNNRVNNSNEDEDEYFNGIIQSISEGSGPVNVYIEEIASK